MINVGRYRFDGPVYSKQDLKDAAGVYAILDDRGAGSFVVLDIGESEQVRTRIEYHDRETCWMGHRSGRVCFAVLYLPGSAQWQRAVIEEELRRQFSPTCGVR